MKAIIAGPGGRPEDMSLRPLPDPSLAPSEVSVRVRFAGVNFMDTGTRRGENRIGDPLVPGVEGMGVVEELGPGASKVHVGARVAWYFHWRSYADTVTLHEDLLIPVPDFIDDEIAAAVPMQGITVHHLATRSYAVRPGSICLVHAAAGGVGSLLTQIIASKGGKVIARVSDASKIDAARMSGASHVLVGKDGHFGDEVRALTGGRGVDAVFDPVGAATFNDSISSLAPHGTLVSFGTASGSTPPIQLERLPRSISVTYAVVMDHVPDRTSLLATSSELFQWVRDRKLRVTVGATYPLAQATQAHLDLESRRTAGKLLLRA